MPPAARRKTSQLYQTMVYSIRHKIIKWLVSGMAVAAAAGFAASSPAQAVTLLPGTYKLEWKIPEADDVCFAGRSGTTLRPLSDDSEDRPKGLCSTQCFSGSTDGFAIFLDESKGTGTGYDTAYVFRESIGSTLDLTQAAKLPLVQDQKMLHIDSRTNSTIDLTIGGPSSSLTKKAKIGLEIYLDSDNRAIKPELAMLTLRGGWYGKVKTDSGELAVQAADVNGNGIYGEKMSIDNTTGYPLPGDAVLIGENPKDLDDYSNVLNLGEVVSYGGLLYVINVSKAGDYIEVQPYTGNTARLTVDARDGSGKSAKCSSAMFYSDSGMFYTSDGSDIIVPPGSYRCLSALIRPVLDTAKEDIFSVLVQKKSAVPVAKGQRTSLKLGGPIQIEIEPESDVVTANPGSQKSIKLTFSIAGSEVAGMQGNYKAWMNIRSSKGKLLLNKKAVSNGSSACEFTINVPSNWKPGIYTIGVGFDPGPYQKIITTQKMLIVVK